MLSNNTFSLNQQWSWFFYICYGLTGGYEINLPKSSRWRWTVNSFGIISQRYLIFYASFWLLLLYTWRKMPLHLRKEMNHPIYFILTIITILPGLTGSVMINQKVWFFLYSCTYYMSNSTTESVFNTTTSSQTYKSQTSYVPESLPKQAQQINCKNMVGYNQILNSQLCCSPAVFLSFRVVKLSLLTAGI